MSASKDKLYVFVKGNKGIGAFSITGPDFKEIYKELVDGESDTQPLYMDLQTMEMSLKYIIEHRGKDQVPKLPVVCIYTTYEKNYEVMSGLKMANDESMKKIKQRLNSLTNTINKNRPQQDGVKYYWVPKGFEMHFDDLTQLLSERKNVTKNKP